MCQLFLESSRCATGISVNCWIRHLKWVVFWEKVLEEDVYANLMAAIEQLPPQCRLVMQLTLEGLKISEIASRLRISEDTVKEHKKNGKQKLARMVENPFLISLIFP